MTSNLDSSEFKKMKTRFKSFAIIDLETPNLPANVNYKGSIMELSVYGIAVSEFNKMEQNSKRTGPPPLPRVLNKLTLCVNPRMGISDIAEKVTGLDNFMLEAESHFNDDCADSLCGFLKHLQQPVCLVAHNGYQFDFPILNYVMQRLSKKMPEGLYGLDSIRAFHDIDELRRECSVNLYSNSVEPDNFVSNSKIDEKYDAQAINQTTPKRPIINAQSAALKRKHNADNNGHEKSNKDSQINRYPKVARSLDFNEIINSSAIKNRNESLRKWYPPKLIYKLSNLFQRTFLKEPVQSHHAESDVVALAQLMLHYGTDFVHYAEAHAILFETIPKLGSPNFL